MKNIIVTLTVLIDFIVKLLLRSTITISKDETQLKILWYEFKRAVDEYLLSEE